MVGSGGLKFFIVICYRSDGLSKFKFGLITLSNDMNRVKESQNKNKNLRDLNKIKHEKIKTQKESNTIETIIA